MVKASLVSSLCLASAASSVSGYAFVSSRSALPSSTPPSVFATSSSKRMTSTSLQMLDTNTIIGAGVAVAGLSVGVGLIVFTENMGQRSGVSEEMATNLSGMFMEDVEKSSVSDIGSLTNQLEKALKESRDDLDEDFEISEEEKKRMEDEADDGW